MTKLDVVDGIVHEFGLSNAQAIKIVNSVFAWIVDGVETDGRVECRGLGVFYLVETPARKARNPRTGAEIDVPVRWALRFRQSSAVARRLNEG